MDIPLVAEAACILEACEWEATQHATPRRSVDLITLTNIGLAYVHLVRAPSPIFMGNKNTGGDAIGLPILPAVRSQAQINGVPGEELGTFPNFCLSRGLLSEESWRAKAAERVLETWGAYAASPAAANDPGLAHIKSVVKVLRDASRGEPRRKNVKK